MKKLPIIIASLSLAIGAGIGLANNHIDAAKAETPIITLDCAAASTNGSTTKYGVASSTAMKAAGLKAFINEAAGSDIVSGDVTINTGSIFWAKGSGGAGAPDNVLKVGTSSAAAGFSFSLGSTTITKAVVTGYGWKTSTSVSVCGATAQKPTTALTQTTFTFEFDATTTFSFDVTSSAYLVSTVELYGSTSTETVDVTGVSLDKTTANLDIGGTVKLTATIAPANATNKNVTWSSSNEAVATVDNGLVTAVSAGNSTITVTTADGSKIATCEVTVNAGPDFVVDMGVKDANMFAKYEGTTAGEAYTKTCDLANAGLNWTAIVTPTSTGKAAITNNSSYSPYGVQFGKGSGFTVESVLLRSDIFTCTKGNSTNKVSVKVGGAGASSGFSVQVKVGGTALTCSDNSVSGQNTKLMSFTSETPLMGRVEITLTNTSLASSSGMKLFYIGFSNVTNNTTAAGQANDFAAKVEAANGCSDDLALVTEYNNLSSDVKTLVDAMEIYDYESGDTAHAKGKTATYTVADKIEAITLAASESSFVLAPFSRNSQLLIVVLIAVSCISILGAALIIKKRKHQ